MCCSGGIWPGGNCSCVWLFWCSVVPARGQQFNQGVGWVCGVQSDFLSPFPLSGGIKFLEAGLRGTE